MLFTTILASTLALSMGVSAAPRPAPPADTRYVQLRLWGEPSCSALNQGELGVYGGALNQCQTFNNNTIVKSVRFEAKYFDTCTVALYDDVTCSSSPHEIQLETCLSSDAQYRSYLVQCPGVPV
ncbi:hypothetical protein AFCA_011597 [Aspergillus flavus]|uniref:Uncharacterized protein n=2 Tax=Aspergillus subgen. Circumdati TaxID=2720871 RepID=A0A5N6IM97_9EURO|nr:hypothetical protein BDV30DRAFT_220305 [Aspergillus minisclerotigenes]KAJ1714787.1 hypothetical protein NYO67_3104 [Aspergillus flavus]KOC14089.1 hypothetical protein AFLA70_104g002241 [Aspergillus flavus AF70]RAQ50851.1 hypothetical protein AFGD_003218 [Aspergillus flavus]RMZ38712.1 hypothetical protein CA14_011953 [Aspergillus flavus]